MSKSVHVFTSAAINYLPKVRMLFESVRRFHPDWSTHLVLADKLPEDIDIKEDFIDSITPVSDLGIDDWLGWSFCHNITELATAIKPWMLLRLLRSTQEGDVILYLDPDIVVFSELSDIVEALDNSSITLTPHQVVPEQTIANIIDNEICSLKHGIYNLGFIGVSNSKVAYDFANWWAQRTYYFCRDDIPNGLFTDQRWIDLVPAFFPEVSIIQSPRHNVATWNITTRHLSSGPEGKYLVDNQPLGFYHFTGFDSGAHDIMAVKNGNGNPALAKLVEWYHAQIAPLANDPLSKQKLAYNYYDSGNPIPKRDRLIYRCRQDLQDAYPNPYSTDGFERWIATQGPLEHPSLFNSDISTSTGPDITAQLTAGFGYRSLFDRQVAARLLSASLTSPRLALSLAKKSWRILTREGYQGIRARLR